MKHFYNPRPLFSMLKRVSKLAPVMPLLAILAWPSSKLFAQAPAISYNTPQTYLQGTAISPLSPTSTGGAVGAVSVNLSQTAIWSGSDVITGLARDNAGNTYFADVTAGAIDEIPNGSSTPSVIIAGIGSITSLATDASGNVYAADASLNQLLKIPGGGGSPTPLGSFTQPVGVVIDGVGNVYVADASQGVYKMAQDGSGQTLISSTVPAHIAADAGGNVYFSDSGNNVYEIPVGGAQKLTGYGGQVMTTDASGDIYIQYSSNIYLCPAGDGAAINLGAFPQLSSISTMVVDAGLNFYYTGSIGLYKINSTGGYFVSPELPQGLTIDPTSGIISGTPTTLSSPANYTVSAFNSTGSGTATVNIGVEIPLPAISYSTPQTYPANTPITPLAPASTGGTVGAPAFNSSITTLYSNSDYKMGAALDKAGNFYFGDRTSDQFLMLAPGSSTPVVLPGFGFTEGVAIDASGNIYGTISSTGKVYKLPAGGGARVPFGGAFAEPLDVAIDPSGYIYIADGKNGIYKMDPAGDLKINISSTPALFITIDSNGNIFFTDASTNSTIYEIPAGGAQKVFYNAPTTVNSPTCDPSGNLYYVDASFHIQMLPAGGGAPVQVGAVTDFSYGLAIDANYNLYYSGAAVRKTNLVGGYFVSPELPQGLSMDPTTGIISGTPVTNSPAANYTVTAFNASGAGTTTINIGVNLAPPTISYTTPQTYTTGTAITPLAPASTGNAVAAPGFNAQPALLGAMADPTPGNHSLAMDKAGNIYIGDPAQGKVWLLAHGSSTPAVFASGFTSVGDIALDASGNVYVPDPSAGTLSKIPAGGGTAITLGSFSQPVAAAIDPNGNIYVSDTQTGLYQMAPDGSAQTLIFNNQAGAVPSHLSVDLNGDVFFIILSGEIAEIPAGGGNFIVPTSVSTTITAFTTDASGNFYYMDAQNDIYRIAAAGGTPVLMAIGANDGYSEGLMMDAGYNLYYTTFSGGNLNVYKANAVGGYFVSPELPAGLTIDPTSGIISGTPTALSPATNYTVSAFNGGGAGTATVNIGVEMALPAISYTTPQTYTTGTAITPLTPASTGGPVAAIALNPTATTLFSTSDNLQNLAMDKAGNIYLTDGTTNQVIKVTPAGASSVFASGFSVIGGVAVDTSGNLYVTDLTPGKVWKVAAGSSTAVAIGGSFNNPYGVATDAAGNVYVADTQSGVYKMAPDGTGRTLISSTPAIGVTVDLNGNVFFTSSTAAGVYEIPAGGAQKLYQASVGGKFITADASGNVYVQYVPKAIYMLPAGGGAPITLSVPYGQGFGGLVVDPGFNLYHIGMTAGDLQKQTMEGGYFVSPELPQGLSMDPTTGIVSGTPAAGSAATNYTVSAFNTSGSGSAIVNIKVISNIATLDSLTTSAGTLNPVFSSAVTTYTDSVAYAVTSITLKPVVTDTTARVKINGVAASSAIPYTMPLNAGTNTADVVVTAGDGVTTDTYVVTIVRALSNNDALSALSLGTGTLRPGFSAATTTYTATVNNNTSTITITPTTADPNATMTIDDAAAASGAAFGPVTLSIGVNPIVVVVTAQDGKTSQTYTVNVTRTAAANDNLLTVSPGAGTLSPAFSNSTTSYTVSVPLSQSIFTVSPTTADPNATVKVNGVSVTSGTASAPIALSAGPNTITITVTAANGVTVKTTTLTVTQTEAASATLAGLTTSAGTLTPAFKTATTSYNVTVNNNVSSIALTPTLTDPSATVTVNGTATASGAASSPVSLGVGSNAVPVVVTAPDGTTKLTYTVNIVRAASSSANLLSLITSGGTLSPVFSNGVTSYAIAVPLSQSAITITPTTADPTATVTVNGSPVTSGHASSPVTLASGPNTITVVVTAGNGINKNTFTLTVTQTEAASAALASLIISPGTLTPAFKTATTSYNVTVNNNVSSITLTPTLTDLSATVKVNGTAVTSGTASSPVSLDVGSNAIPVVVTAPDGTTTQTYTVNVTRTGSANDNLLSLTTSVGALSPAFKSVTTNYSVIVPLVQTSITLTPTVADPTATVKVNGSLVTSGHASSPVTLSPGPNVINVVVTAGNGVLTQTYTVTVTPTASSNANLGALAVSTGSLTPAFAASTTSYNVVVNNVTTSIAITPTVAISTSTVKVNGTAVTSGTASKAISLNVGINTIPVVVTAQNGTTKLTYTVKVTRAASSNTNLLSLVRNPGDAPLPYNGISTYSAGVPNTDTSVTLTPNPADPAATITINGVAVTSGTASGSISLSVGANTIPMVVTSANGVTTKTYQIVITRAAGGADQYITVGVTAPDGNIAIADDGIVVHRGVTPNGDGIEDYLQIDNISQYPDNRLMIMNRDGQLIYETKGYDNSTRVFDGHSNKTGQMQLPGTYFFALDYTVNGVTKHKTGFLVLKY